MTPIIKAAEFLKISEQSKLGHLVTEGFHQKTSELSRLVQNDLKGSLDLHQEIDLDVLSLMAGGDFALIKSVESFEDKTQYGERQLLELGLRPHDLLLASSEGGETPFVIGACQKAA